MKKNIFLLFFLSFFWTLTGARADDSGLTLPAHSGAERSFDSVSKSSVIVVTQFGYGTGTVVKYKKKHYNKVLRAQNKRRKEKALTVADIAKMTEEAREEGI